MRRKRNSEPYSDFSNVEAQRSFLTSEEFPEGSYGEIFHERETVTNKETPWVEGQRDYTPFNYEFKNLHQDIPRQYPGSHPPHDDPQVNEEVPYGRSPED
ncbi:MAG TPA: cytosolic protein [Bacillales bacterium]|nr:cytosolic protein [Bacillales bacterium]